MLLLVAFLAAIPIGTTAPFKTSEEVIPKQVAEAARNQLRHYFPVQQFTGIPLLDTKIDWNQFKNWPDEFTFQGDTYYLGVTHVPDFHEFDDSLRSRADVRPGIAFAVHYLNRRTNFVGRLMPSAHRLKDGSIHGKILDLGNYRVFGCQFYATGKLYCFIRDNFETKDYRLEYFDRDGELVGMSTSAGGHGPSQCEWEGRKVDCDSFEKATLELFNKK